MDERDKGSSNFRNGILGRTNVQHHFSSGDDKKNLRLSPDEEMLKTLLSLNDDKDRNHEEVPSDIEAQERGTLARMAYELPASVVRRILLAYGRHPLVNGVYVGGKLVLPDL